MANEHLREVTKVLQQHKGLAKRWFNSQSADLFVWHDKQTLVRFEFCYDKHNNEHSLRWQEGTGFSHARVDDGENTNSTGMNKRTPILIADGKIDSDYIYEIFKKLSTNIDISVRLFILRKLIGFVSEDY